MIVKITKGNSFNGVARYIAEKSDSCLIGTSFSDVNRRVISNEVAAFRRLRPSLRRAVSHFSLSLSPEDRPLGNEEWAELATQFLSQMGFDQCPYLAYRHHDTDHDHVHIAVLRINASGNVVSDKQDFARARSIARRLEQSFALLSPSEQSKEKKTTHQTRRFHMSTTTQPAVASGATQAERSIYTPTPEGTTDSALSRYKRELKRKALSQDNQQRMHTLFPNLIRSIFVGQSALIVYFNDGSELKDQGFQLTVSNMPDELAAQRLVAVALSKGWNEMIFTGSDSFLEAAFALALEKQIVVFPMDARQKAILDKVVSKIRSPEKSLLDLNALIPMLKQSNARSMSQQLPLPTKKNEMGGLK